MSQRLKDLREKRAQVWEQLKAINDRSKDAAMSAEDQAAWDKGNTEIDAIGADMEAEEGRINAAAEREKRLAEIESTNKAALGDGRVGVDAGRRREENPERVAQIDVRAIALQGWLRAGRGLDLTDEHRQALKAAGVRPGSVELDLPSDIRYGGPGWCVRGNDNPLREFRVGLNVATGGAGVETIPDGFVAELERATLAHADVRRVCRVIRTATGNPLPWPAADDTGNTGEQLDEATSFGTSVDPTFSAMTLNAYKFSSKPVYISQELLEDSAFNMAVEIAAMLGVRLGRIEASKTTTGTGSSTPKGIVACAGTGKTTAAAAAFTANELIDLSDSLDPSYESGSTGFMFHKTCLTYLRKLQDGNGQYLWQPGLQAGVPNLLLDKPYSLNQQMEPLVNGVPVTAKKHILYGDFSKFVIRLVAADRFYRLDELARQTDQTAFIAFRRLDSDTINASALKVLLQA